MKSLARQIGANSAVIIGLIIYVNAFDLDSSLWRTVIVVTAFTLIILGIRAMARQEARGNARIHIELIRKGTDQ